MLYALATTPAVGGFILPMIVAELVLVLVLSWAIGKLSTSVAAILFVLYSLLTGATLSTILLIYTGSSVLLTFAIAASTF